MLRQMGLDPKSVNPAEIRSDYEAMQARKATLESTYKSAEKEARALQQKMANVEQYLSQEQSPSQHNLPLGQKENRTI